MELLAAAIVFAVVLNLIDRNQKWAQFWAVCKWLLQFAAAGIVWSVLKAFGFGIDWKVLLFLAIMCIGVRVALKELYRPDKISFH